MIGATANELFRETQRLVTKFNQPVFPCRSVGKKAKAPLTRNGLNDATTDIAQIRSWWKQYREGAAIGIPTGIVWDVLDVDVKREEDGRVHLPVLQRLGLLNGCKFVVKTPSGGWHLYFKAAPGLTNKANRTLGLDVRSKGGYVLAPPSFIDVDDGDDSYYGSYEMVGETTGSTDEPLLWDLIVSSITPVNTQTKQPIAVLPSERRASIASLREWVANLQAGERNNGLHWAVCRCIDNGIDPHELVDAATLTGLEEDEILLTVNSAIRRAGLTVHDLETEVEALFPDEA